MRSLPGSDSGVGFVHSRSDFLAIEEPLQFCLNGSALSITMRAPGSDLDIAGCRPDSVDPGRRGCRSSKVLSPRKCWQNGRKMDGPS